MGLAISDGSVIRPIDDPILARVIFDWDTILVESLSRRCELRKQKWLVKRREKELEASKNFLMPRLDLIGRYRWRGFGRDLLEQHDGPKFSGGGVPTESQFNNAWGNLLGGNFQEWQLGFEFSVPLGNRRGHAAVRNSELLLARERAILKEQEREVVHNLTNAIAEASRAYVGVETNLNRKIAADDQLKAVQAAFDVDRAPLDLVLDAQRRVADAETNYFRARTEYGLAIKNVHFAKGSLLDYNEVYLSEGMWPVKAYYDAAERRERLSRPLDIFKMLSIPDGVSAGVFPQLIEPTRDDDDQDAPKLDQQVPPAPIENPASDNSETAEVKEVASPRPLGEGPSSRRPSASARSSAKDKSFIHNKPVPLGSWNESDVPIVPSATDKSSATPVGENELLKSISAGINEQPLRENGSE
jgi:hypothetical protein